MRHIGTDLFLHFDHITPVVEREGAENEIFKKKVERCVNFKIFKGVHMASPGCGHPATARRRRKIFENFMI